MSPFAIALFIAEPLLTGIVTIVGAIAAWFLVGDRDPLETMFDMQEELQVASRTDR